MPLMVLSAIVVGALWIGFVGVLRHFRGVNETISSLLLFYIAVAIMNFFVEGVLRDPSNPNKPSTTRSATPTWSATSPAPAFTGACRGSSRRPSRCGS